MPRNFRELASNLQAVKALHSTLPAEQKQALQETQTILRELETLRAHLLRDGEAVSDACAARLITLLDLRGRS